jgi:ribosomal protein L29
MAEKKILSEKEVVKKIKDLKIELLKSPTKKGRVKKEIARLLTMAHNSVPSKKGTKVPSSSGKNLAKPEEGEK